MLLHYLQICRRHILADAVINTEHLKKHLGSASRYNVWVSQGLPCTSDLSFLDPVQAKSEGLKMESRFTTSVGSVAPMSQVRNAPYLPYVAEMHKNRIEGLWWN